MIVPAAVAHPPPDTGAALVRSVTMDDTSVRPAALVVAPGTSVSWINVGRNRHTVTEDAGAFDSGILAPGASFRLSAPPAPGTYAYHCVFHGYIRGTLTVSTVSLATPPTVVVGGRPALTGSVPGAAEGTVVRLERRVPGAWVEVGRTAVDGAGDYRLTGPPLTGRTAFRALAGEDLSPSVRATARPSLTVRRRGALLLVGARPAARVATAHLERIDLDTYRWSAVAARPFHGGGTRFRLRAPGVYRVAVPARHDLEGAVSRAVPFRSAAFRE